MEEQNLPYLNRLYIYQKERFPVLMNIIAVLVFTFSAIAYSRLCRGVEGFVPWQDYAIGCFATFTLFLLVRIFDEHKDQKEDALYRSYLPVPRGVVTLRELRNIGIVVAMIQIAVIAVFQTPMLWLYLIVMVYLCLMGVEFFVPRFLKKRQLLYITSHMIIIPLLDIYSSGIDWLLSGASPHWGLLFFFVVSYMNGLVVEFGRKMKPPGQEEEGVVSYTKMWGVKGAVAVWLGVLWATFGVASGAAFYASFGWPLMITLIVFVGVCSIPGFAFLKNPTMKTAKNMEKISGLWTILMYLSLGAIPMLIQLLS